VTEFKKKVQVL